MSKLIFLFKIFRYEFVEKRPVIYLDERGYSEKCQKCYADRNWHTKGRVNAIGAIINFKLLNVCLFDCNINTDVFYCWFTEQLLPIAPKNAVIVLDNAPFHKRNDILSTA